MENIEVKVTATLTLEITKLVLTKNTPFVEAEEFLRDFVWLNEEREPAVGSVKYLCSKGIYSVYWNISRGEIHITYEDKKLASRKIRKLEGDKWIKAGLFPLFS